MTHTPTPPFSRKQGNDMNKLPTFKDILDAIRYGRCATPIQIDQLRKRRDKQIQIALLQSDNGNKHLALQTICFAQFDREAIQAWTEKELAII